MSALDVLEADSCPGCRAPLSETTGQDEHGRPVRYVVDDPHRCRRCDALIRAQRDAQKTETDALPAAALLWSAQRA